MKMEQIRNVTFMDLEPEGGMCALSLITFKWSRVLGWGQSYGESQWEGSLARSVVFASRIFPRADVLYVCVVQMSEIPFSARPAAHLFGWWSRYTWGACTHLLLKGFEFELDLTGIFLHPWCISLPESIMHFDAISMATGELQGNKFYFCALTW